MKKSRFKSDNWIINTKLSPPNLPSKQIRRQQLIEKVTHSQGYQLTIIHAPAGYGKTTFLKQWYEYHLQKKGAASWLSLDEEEKSVSQLFVYLVAALDKAGVPCQSLEKIVNQGVDSLSIRSISAIIINTLEQFDRELLLFIDDYQLVSSKPVNELIQKLVFRLPVNVSFIISSRVFPELAIQSLRTQDKVQEIAISDLRFDIEESNLVIANKLHSVELQRLWDRTEGWPIACHMIHVLLRNKLFDAKHLNTFSGRTSDLAAYITEQVFASLAEREQKFIMYTAITNRFTGDLASVLCTDIDCWGILEDLQRKDLFLIPLDTDGKWYRYHQLFREYLYERLRRNDGEKIPKLHVKAAEWLFDNGYVPEAVEHALKGNDPHLVANILDSLGGWRLIYQGKFDWIMSVLDRLPKYILEEYPRLFMAELVILIKRGKLRDALKQVKELHDKTNGFEKWGGKPLEKIIRIEFELVRQLILEDYNDQPVSESTLSFALEYLKLIPNDDYILKALLHDAMCSAYIDAGMLDKAGSHINNAEIMYKESGSYYGTIYICYHRANLYMERAQLHDADKELQKAKEITSEYLDANFNIVANTSAYLADVAYMRNQIQEAQLLLDKTLDFIEKHDGWFDLYAKAYSTAAGAALITHGTEDAIAMLSRARRTANERNLPRLKILSDLMEIRLLLLVDQIAQAQELADVIGVNSLVEQGPCSENLSVFIPERAAIVLARLQLMQEEPESVLNLLHPMALTLQTQGRLRFLVEIWLLMARAAYAINDGTRAESFIDKAVHISMHEEYKRPFIDEGEGMLRIYESVLNNRRVKGRNRLYRAFLTDVNRIIQHESQVVNKRINKYGLTDKEYKVIVELAKGHSNKEIASVLYISEDTVKYRLKKLFKKWGVTSRNAAIRTAREKSLL
jgi:ATP/maltotriose-dependent transcriptional regulator MalT